MHVILPRADYEIVEDSWDVVGLRGTGSKDVIVKDAFVPDYRVIEYNKVVDGSLAVEAGLTNPAYRLPFSAAFPLGITAAVIGICEGALAHHLDYQRGRVQITGQAVKDDPYVLYAISEAAAEIAAARSALLDNICRIHDAVAAGEEISFERRAVGRAHPGRRGLAGRSRGRRDSRPLRRQRDAAGQPDPALLARRARGPHARHPCAGIRLPRLGPHRDRHRAAAGPDALDDLTPSTDRRPVSERTPL